MPQLRPYAVKYINKCFLKIIISKQKKEEKKKFFKGKCRPLDSMEILNG